MSFREFIRKLFVLGVCLEGWLEQEADFETGQQPLLLLRYNRELKEGTSERSFVSSLFPIHSFQYSSNISFLGSRGALVLGKGIGWQRSPRLPEAA